MTDTQQIIKDHYSKLGKRSLETMTPEQRKERAKKAVQATKRWKDKNCGILDINVSQGNPIKTS